MKKKKSKSRKIYQLIATLIILGSSFCIGVNQPAEAPPITWILEVVDKSPDVGDYNSLAFDGTGIPHIAYRRADPFPTAVLHAYKIGGVWYNETVFWDAGIVGEHVSIAIDSKDIIHISFFANDMLYYSTNTSGSWVETIVDEDPMARVGLYTSIDVDSSDYPKIAYYDSTNARLKYASYNDISWDIDVVDGGSGGNEAGDYCSLAMGPDDTPHISYHFTDSSFQQSLKHAWKVGNSWNDEVVDNQNIPGKFTSIAVDDSKDVHISYYRANNKDLMYAYKNGTTWNKQAVNTTGDVGYYTSLALNRSNDPHIAHFDQGLKEIKRTWKEFGVWYTESVVPCGDLTNHGSISIAFDIYDMPKISYYDARVGNLNYTQGFLDFIDLIPTEMWFDIPGPYDVGDNITVTANITNAGTQAAGTFLVRFYDGDPDLGGVQIGIDQVISSLGPGNFSIVSVLWTAEDPGHHEIYVEVNPTDTVLDPFQDNDKIMTWVDIIQYGIWLEEGWNLISLTKVQSNPYLLDILQPISGDFDAVQFFNTTDESEKWKTNHVDKPDFLDDLWEINHTLGFWINIIKPGRTMFNVSGSKFTESQSIVLHPGWNLVGYPAIQERNRTLALNNLEFGTHIDAIWTYNATSHSWISLGSSDKFERGRGYWIHCNHYEDIAWIVPL